MSVRDANGSKETVMSLWIRRKSSLPLPQEERDSIENQHFSCRPESLSKVLFTMSNLSVSEPELEKPANGSCSDVYEKYVLPSLAEFLGTAFFIFNGCASVIENTEGTGRLQPALAHGLALGISVAIFARVSGGHMNPAVSLCAALIGGLNIFLLIPYWAAQFCGGMVGAALAKVITSDVKFFNATGAAFKSIERDEQVGSAIVAEVVMTAYLVMTVCMGTINKKSTTPLAPLCIGLSVTVGILAGGSVSGGCMNPARALGSALVANYWDYHWVYWVGPITGSLIVGLLLRVFIGDQKIRVLMT
ncbi:aquaporin-8-like [Acipenser oxyrinchus oxyrinchus]|uniref:Aquaporin-8-like n=1 Tax=Acipenser oxyrinchus oxyrinchus TaxID=40147 RepID=A0AAD8LLU0_ACIOX|nr:aquaporin-8-like [Acipenser oxyrinchus oxyrinchus]